MAKLNKWANIIKNVAQKLRGKRKAENRIDGVPNMSLEPDVQGANTAPKKSLGIMNKAFENMKKRKAPDINPAFDIFPEDMQSQYENQNDREISEETDGYKTGVETYLENRKSKKDITPTQYNDEDFVEDTDFSSPPQEQNNTAETNTGGFEEIEDTGVSYDDPIISTKPTPTSEKLGLPRPGPSSFIQTARYNPATKRLNIAYTDGKIFPYYDVSPETADEILKKKAHHSPGQTLLGTIFYDHGTNRTDEIYDIEEGI